MFFGYYDSCDTMHSNSSSPTLIDVSHVSHFTSSSTSSSPSSPTSSPSSTTTTTDTVYTMDEVRRHKSVDDLWVVVHDKVYDLTHFVKDHPGGMSVIMGEAGKDATLSFEDIGHSYTAYNLLEKFKIGVLAPRSLGQRSTTSSSASSSSSTTTTSPSQSSSSTTITSTYRRNE
ncbi:hypothetical protein SAMD00019534_110640 [Acytostelium subglobosum LB1]|uniref:hypothetical protein n=1 Tax=Acytostelium subglobosum LB1 TaxID=1410327 RepID=UPI0006451CF4|nr:hypothetical protein SAMD00019534_110640 [Acytostelium subglobosum LB1]GAM27888.1 hypothetical protein SAMD00019534_110640 [Acytostelium subglobosum LB1]|eukprot:XP_012749171.1 hypothetical protein SAMD00019534_110640 [Acytostelium subglobosum LB1]